MKKTKKTVKPFVFYTRLHLSQMTGLRAANISQLMELIKQVSGSCIYHHTHRFLQIHQYLSPEPPNDFAYWVNYVLGEDELGERLASIDTVQFSSIRSLREKIIQTIENYIENNPLAKLRFSRKDEEFHFIESISFIIPTKYSVTTLRDFSRTLKKVTIDSIYFHIFESRLRLEKQNNDFSAWIDDAFGNKILADSIARLDPYTHTLEDLRKKLINIVDNAIKK